MRDRNSDDLTSWEQAFVELNDKLGNEVWGIRQEPNGNKGFRLRVYINEESWEEKVLEETNGTLDGQPLVFTVYDQDEYTLDQARRAMNEDLRRKAEEYAEETETATRDPDGDVQGDSR